jgi:hypothetical protein
MNATLTATQSTPSPADGAVQPPATARMTSPLVSTAAVAMLLVLALVKGLSSFAEPDVWWHLQVGDSLRSHLDLTFWDPSARLAAREYTATQWLPEVIASLLSAALGDGVVLWLRAAAVVALVVTIYWACRRYAGRLPAVVATGLALIGAGAGLNPRPQLISFVLFALVVHAWCGMAADRRPRWWLVPLFWVWACSHELWAFGLAVGAIIFVTLMADPLARPSHHERSRLSVLWGACALAVASTPLGPALLVTPFQVTGNASIIADEWRATPLNNVFSWAAFIMVASTAVLWAVRPARRPWWQLAMIGFGAACVLWMLRLVPLGCISVAPLLAGALQEHLTAGREPVTPSERRALLAGTAALLAVAAAVAASPLGTSAQRYPGVMGPIDRALDSLPRHAVVLDDFAVSGWLLREHPGLTPVADLRGEIYSRSHLTAYRDVLRAKPGWQHFVRRTSSEVALLERESPLADALVNRLGWAMMASTDDYVLLRRPAR